MQEVWSLIPIGKIPCRRGHGKPGGLPWGSGVTKSDITEAIQHTFNNIKHFPPFHIYRVAIP